MKLGLFTCIIVLAAGCGMDGDCNEGPPYTIGGGLIRTETATIAPGRDGRGTAYVIALTACRLDAAVAGAAVVPQADLVSLDDQVDFAVSDLVSGVYYLAAFVDDEADADSMNPRPGPGDLVHAPNGAGNGVLDCVVVEVAEADARGIIIPLTTTVADP